MGNLYWKMQTKKSVKRIELEMRGHRKDLEIEEIKRLNLGEEELGTNLCMDIHLIERERIEKKQSAKKKGCSVARMNGGNV